MVIYREGTMLFLMERFLATPFYPFHFHIHFFSEDKNGTMMRRFQNWNLVFTRIGLKAIAATVTQCYTPHDFRTREFGIKCYLEGKAVSETTYRQIKLNGKWRSSIGSEGVLTKLWLRILFLVEFLNSIVQGTDLWKVYFNISLFQCLLSAQDTSDITNSCCNKT